MSLRDHFRPPLAQKRHWHAFHNAWATYLASDLNRQLPDQYFAEPNVEFGIEIDDATFDDQPEAGPGPCSWLPGAPTRTLSFPIVSDSVEIRVYGEEGGPRLAGAIELVSPANKDRPAHRDAFVAKCETHLAAGVGLVVVDVVTSRPGNLHAALLERLGEPTEESPPRDLLAVSYRVVEREGEARLDLWEEALELGGLLPTLPLWLAGSIAVPVELDATYDRTCAEQRVPR